MSKNNRQLHLNAFLLGVGQHGAAWRHQVSNPADVFSVEHYIHLAQIAEKGKLDAVFFADIAGMPEGTPESRAALASGVNIEPTTLVTYLSAFTKHIGFIATVSTTYTDPFTLARRFAAIDLVTSGRIGWNLVTSHSDYEARNFGLEQQFAHADRYKRATEFVDVVKGLWDSFEDDAFVGEKDNLHFFDPDKLHVLHHKGEHFSVQGPLHTKRPLQGYPVIVQAGSSEPGKELAAYSAEVVFTAHQTLQSAQAFYKDLKLRLAKYRRKEDELAILPGLQPIIGKTEEEAHRKYEELQALIPDTWTADILSSWLGFDLSGYDLDAPFPEEALRSEGLRSRQELFWELSKRENLSIRQVFRKIVGARGHLTVVGTAKTIADTIEEWFANGAADGFNIMPQLLPNSLQEFVDEVVPELQRRGLFRTEYNGNTLRENLELKRPGNQYSK